MSRTVFVLKYMLKKTKKKQHSTSPPYGPGQKPGCVRGSGRIPKKLLYTTRAVGGQRARLLGTFYIVTFLSLSHII